MFQTDHESADGVDRFYGASARGGEIELEIVERDGRRGLSMIARAQGRGIPDIQRAIQDGFSSFGGLRLELTGGQRLMNEFHTDVVVGQSTTISMKKWAKA